MPLPNLLPNWAAIAFSAAVVAAVVAAAIFVEHEIKAVGVLQTEVNGLRASLTASEAKAVQDIKDNAKASQIQADQCDARVQAAVQAYSEIHQVVTEKPHAPVAGNRSPGLIGSDELRHALQPGQ